MINQRSRSIEWWDASKEDLPRIAFNWLDHCVKANGAQRADAVIHVELANSFNVDGLSGYSSGISQRVEQGWTYPIRENIIRSGIDSVAALVSQARTSPQYTTTDGDWEISRIAEKRSWVLQGQMYNLSLFETVPKGFVQACEAGTGFVHGYLGADNTPAFELCGVNEVVCDPEDARYGTPESIGRIKFIARGELQKLYPKAAGLLEMSQGPSAQDYHDFWISPMTHGERVKVLEIYKKATVRGGNDGRHVIVTNNAVLLDEGFSRRRIPIVPIYYAKRPQGFYGVGMAERMRPAQWQICKMDSNIERFGDLVNVYWFVDTNSEVEPSDISDFPGQIIEYMGGTNPPTAQIFDTIPQAYLAQRETIKQRAFENEGVSSAVVTGDVQNGLTSGKAIRASDDVGSRRFINPTRFLEWSYLEIVHVLEDLNDDAAAIDPDYQVTAKRRAGKRTWMTRAKWSDLYLEPDDVTVQMFPISATAALTPQAKWSTLQEWIQGGFISQPQALDQMGLPDLEAEESLSNSNLDLCHEQISQMLDAEGDPRMFLPIPQQDLQMAGQLIQLAYLSAWRNGAPDEILTRFENYLDYTKQLSAPPPAPPADPMMDPNAAPMPVDPNAAPPPMDPNALPPPVAA